ALAGRVGEGRRRVLRRPGGGAIAAGVEAAVEKESGGAVAQAGAGQAQIAVAPVRRAAVRPYVEPLPQQAISLRAGQSADGPFADADGEGRRGLRGDGMVEGGGG